MPTYSVSLTVPAKTRPATPVQTRLSITGPRLFGGTILFPSGCLGLVGVRISNYSHQIFPIHTGWVVGNGNPPIQWKETTVLEGPGWDLLIEGYNMARDWPHTVQIQVVTG